MFWGEVVGLGSAAALLGDVERSRQIRDLIAPYREHSAVLGVAAFLGAVPHHCGVLNGVLGEWDDAVADLEIGLERHRAISARPWVALSQIELARVLAARDGPGDAARAAKLAAEAAAVADELDLGAVKTRAGQAGCGVRRVEVGQHRRVDVAGRVAPDDAVEMRVVGQVRSRCTGRGRCGSGATPASPRCRSA